HSCGLNASLIITQEDFLPIGMISGRRKPSMRWVMGNGCVLLKRRHTMRLMWKLFSFVLLVVLLVSVVSADEPKSEPKPDPSGTATGTVADIPAKEAGKPTPEEIADAVGRNRVGINMTWTLNTGYLVMFMAAGFALVAAGFTRAKNVAHT